MKGETEKRAAFLGKLLAVEASRLALGGFFSDKEADFRASIVVVLGLSALCRP